MKNLKEITEKEFLKIILESEETTLKEITELKNQFYALVHLREYSKEYKNLGFNLKYLYNQKTKQINFEVYEREVGFTR